MRFGAILSAILCLAAFAAPAAAEGPSEPGDTVTGAFTAAEPVIIPFRGLEGSLVTFTVVSRPGTLDSLEIQYREGTSWPAFEVAQKLDRKARKIVAKKVLLPRTGTFYLLVHPAPSADLPVTFTVKTKAKLPKKRTLNPFPVSNVKPAEVAFPAMPGALLTVKIQAGKISTLLPRIDGILDPSGAEVDLSGVKRKSKEKSDLVAKVPLTSFGDYTIRIGTREGSGGDVGKLSIKAKQPKPRKAKISADVLDVYPFLETVNGVKHESVLESEAKVLFLGGRYFAPGAEVVLEDPDQPGVPLTEGFDLTVTRLDHRTLQAVFTYTGAPLAAPRKYVAVVRNGALRSADNPDNAPPDGDDETPDDGVVWFTVYPVPVPTGTDPSPLQTFNGAWYGAVPMRITGTGFLPGLTLEFTPSLGVGGERVEVESVTPTEIRFTVNTWDVSPGDYQVAILNPARHDGKPGGVWTPTAALALTVKEAPVLSDVTPAEAFDTETVTLEVSGTHLLAGARVFLVPHGAGPEETALAEGTTLAVNGAGKTVSTVDLSVIELGTESEKVVDLKLVNPDGGLDILTRSLPAFVFKVKRAPVLTKLTPVRAFAGEEYRVSSGNPAVIEGKYLATAATAHREKPGESNIDVTSLVRADPTDGTRLNGDLSLAGAPPGSWSLHLTNPNGGPAKPLADALAVLGALGLVENSDGASEPAVIYHPDRDEYLVVWTQTIGGDTDIRARRLSADTGLPLGDEIEVTKTSGTKEDHPHVALDTVDDRYLVVYRSGGTAIKAQELTVTGGLGTSLSLASDSDSRGRPRVCYNPDDREFLAVFGRQVIRYDEDGNETGRDWDVDAARIPAAGGLSQSTVKSFTLALEEFDEREPDVVYSPYGFAAVYVVVYARDFAESGGQPDTKSDVYVVQLEPGDTLPRAGTLLTVTETSDDERRPRIARVPGTSVYDPDEMLIVWERTVSSSNHDLYARRYDTASLSGGFPASATRVEETASTDAREADLVWDGDFDVYRIVYSLGGEDIVMTRMNSTQGNAVHTTLVDGGSGDTNDQPVIAARGGNSEAAAEILAVFRTDSASASERDLEALFHR